MRFASGSRLGPYEITALLGAGGMGEVYKARDTRLDRDVAVKVLPADVSANAERRARFEREARAIAALSHPHICALFDIGEAPVPNPQSPIPNPESVHYLVMEHLAGETLAERLGRGPLSVAEALDLAAQIADALEAAHKHGIVHRDLKPGNVMLTSGRVGRHRVASAKLLDFGLAKLTGHGERPALAAATAVATAAIPVTAEGTIIGTLQYMAPEQLKGHEADARTDLWALGVILYEMVTGRRAFEGDGQMSLIGNIMNAEPPALAQLQPLAPPALDHVVRTCLAKDPEERWQSAADVRRELSWVAEASRSGSAPAGAWLGHVPGRRRWSWVAAVAALTLTVAGAAAVVTWLATRPVPAAGQPLYLEIEPDPAERFQDGSPGSGINAAWQQRPKNAAMAFSPDGKLLAFAAAAGDRPPQLYLRDLGRRTAVPVPGTERAAVPVFSPDGRSIAFWSAAASAWMRAPLDGSSQPVQICRSGPPFGGAWAPDGTFIFANEWGPLWAVPASGGTPTPLTIVPADSKESHRLPHILPDGRGVLFTVLDYSPFSVADWNAARVEVVQLAGGVRKRLLDDAADAQYLPTGHLLYGRRGALECVPFDLSRFEVTGGPIGVQPDVMQSVDTASTNTETGAAQVAVSQTGMLAFLTGGTPPLPDFADFAWIDRAGRLEPVAAIPPGPYFGASLSRDGHHLAFRGAGTKPGLWVYDVGRGVPQRVTSTASHRWPLWTPDGRQLVYGTSDNGRWMLALRDLDGGAPRTLLAPGYGPACWSRDGKVLVFTTAFNPAADIVEQSDIWVLRRDAGGITTEPWLQTPADEDHPALSPDDRWLAYASTEPGPGQTSQVYVRPLSGTGGPWQVSDRGGTAPRWSPDGKELFYLALDADPFLFSSAVGGETVPSFGPPRKLVQLRGAVVTTPLPSYDTVDGRRFIYLHRRAPDITLPPPPRAMHIVLNWFEELKAKAPAR